MNKYFIVIKFKSLINDGMRSSSFAHAGRTARLAIFGFAMLLGFPAYAGDQYLLVSNREGRNILRYDAQTGAFVDELVAKDSGGMVVPYGMTLGPDHNLYVTSWSNDTFPASNPVVLKFDSNSGEYLGTFASASGMSAPADLLFGPDGNLYVTDAGGKIFRFDGTTGASKGIFATGHPGDSFIGLAWDPDGNLYVAPEHGHHLDHFDGVTGASLGTLPTLETSLSTFMTFGPDGLLYVSDYFGGDVDVYNINNQEFVESIHGLNGPAGLVFSDDGDFLVSSYFSNQIVKFENGSGLPGTVFTGGPPLHGPIDLVMTPVPEASTYAMLLAGLGLLGFSARRRK